MTEADNAAKDRRIEDLIADAEKNLISLLAVVDEMKRQNAAQRQQTEDERRA